MFFPPLIFLFILCFFFIWLFLLGFIHLGLIGYAFQKIGIPPDYMMSLLLFCLFGSFINIPIKKISTTRLIEGEIVSFWGLRFRIPIYKKGYTILAINLGGAVIPVLISMYLIFHFGQYFRTIIAIAIVAFVTYRFARPMPGVGITVPIFIPPITAALVSIILTSNVPALAYISGTLGTLIGADLMNLDKIRGLQAPIVSIGGAGTFDGIFFTGILAVLLA